jgi:hypothetical protein
MTPEEASQKFTLDEDAESVPGEVVEEAEPSTSLQLPEGAYLPEGATLREGADDGYCRVMHADGRRCQGIRMKATGLCPPHSGRSRILDDPRGMQARGAGAKVRARERRQILVANGINPRLAAREAAIRRSDAVVRALVDDVLDAEDMSAQARQRAVIGMLDAVFPLSTVSTEIELPSDPESMGWSDMQRLAAQLTIETEGVAEG